MFRSFSVSFLLVFIFVLSTIEAQDVVLEKGATVSTFSGTSDEGIKWESTSFLGKKNVVIYFYPAAMTGGCTKQACAYRDDMEKFKRMETEVIGVSGDIQKNLKLFKEAHQLNFTLLSDPKGEIAKIFGVPSKDGEKTIEREIAGIKYMLTRGVTTSRWTFVIDKDGKLIYKSTEVNAAEDSKMVFEALSGL